MCAGLRPWEGAAGCNLYGVTALLCQRAQALKEEQAQKHTAQCSLFTQDASNAQAPQMLASNKQKSTWKDNMDYLQF
jgi:hypothetical protein